jgi:hypothetical protein
MAFSKPFRPRADRRVRLLLVGDRLAFVMLSGAKHLANEGNERQSSDAAQILRCRSG